MKKNHEHPIELKSNRLLSFIEKLGNKVPHTLALFFGIIVLVLIISAIYAWTGVKVYHPATGEEIVVNSLLNKNGLILFFTTFISNFQSFPILGVTVVVCIAMGLCEVTGMFTAVIRMSLKRVPESALALFVSFFGIFMCSFDGTVSMIVVPTLAASIYYSMGKSPLVGIFCGYAAACAGASLEFIPGFWQVCLTPITNAAAQLFDANFSMPLLSDYYPVLFSSVMMIIIVTLITVKIIEPRFGKETGCDDPVLVANQEEDLTPQQRKAAKWSLISLLLYLLAIIAMCIPHSSFFRNAEGSLINGPLMSSLENLLVWFFFIPGLVYAKMTGQIKSVSALANLLEKGAVSLLPVIVLFILIGQFLTIFQATNLAAVVSIQLGDWLGSISISPYIVLAIIFVFVVLLDLFVTSGSSKYIIFAPILIPVLMQLGITPAFSQYVLRMSDAAVNNLTPFNPFFPILVVLAQRYCKKVGIGTVFSAMLPYSILTTVVMLIIIGVWMLFDLPVGVNGARIFM